VALASPTKLSDEEKLETVRRLDQFRQWRSLDEKRYCLVCGKIITGRQVRVMGGTRGNGPLHISCPTERCNSIPMDWVLPTDEVLAKVDMTAVETGNAPSSADRSGAGHGIASHFKFAVPFQASFLQR